MRGFTTQMPGEDSSREKEEQREQTRKVGTYLVPGKEVNEAGAECVGKRAKEMTRGG